MTVLLGKRQRRDYVRESGVIPDGEYSSEYDDQLQALLRQNFERSFGKLDSFGSSFTQDTYLDAGYESEMEQSDWSGFSEEDQERSGAITIDYQSPGKTKVEVFKKDLKMFMQLYLMHLDIAKKYLQSAKPPTEDVQQPSLIKARTTEPQDPEEAATDAANLKKDLALQRLLQESHLLDTKSSLTPSGQNRHRALDVRQQALGSKTSVFTQDKMPLAQRRGIMAKSTSREERRRQEAKESGIILEKAIKSKVRIKDSKRERGIGAPSVGKFSRGMLTLSKGDVTKIVGPTKRSKRR
ncbi:MAG: hypothetical protein Q9213_008099 [Squamulea squamosa]